MSGSKKLSEKAKGKQKAKAAALPLGRALLSASLPLCSKKREHQLTVPELSTAAGPSGTGVSERQIRRDTAAMQEFAFKQTADNPESSPYGCSDCRPHALSCNAAAPADGVHAAVHGGATGSHASGLQCNTRDSTQEVTAFGAKATATETQHKNSLYRGALTGEEAEHGQISQFSRFMQQSRRKVAKHSSSKRKAVEGGNLSGDLAPKRKKRCDATAGDPIFTEIWHTFSEQVKGQRGTKRKHLGTAVELIPTEDGAFQIQKKPRYEYHDARIQTMTCEEISVAIKSWPAYQKWKADNPRKVSRLKTGDISTAVGVAR